MNRAHRRLFRARWLSLATLATLLVFLLCLPLLGGAQGIPVDYGEPPELWGGSGVGYWTRVEEYLETGRTGYTAKLSNGQMSEYDEMIVTNADLGVDWMETEPRDGFGQRYSQNFYCEPIGYDTPLAPEVTVIDDQFHGYPATIFTGYCRHESYSYRTEVCDMEGNCEPDTTSGVEEEWKGGFTSMTRVTCVEMSPGVCSLIWEQISAHVTGPAALGEHAEQDAFDAILAEVDAWKARWTIEGEAPAAPPPPTDPPLAEERTITIEGTVGVKDPISQQVKPIIDAPINVQRGDVLFDFDTTKAPDGSFVLQTPITDSLVLSTTLVLAGRVPSTFRMTYDQADPTLWIATPRFALDEKTPDTLGMKVDLSASGSVAGPVAVPPDRVKDLALIYHYAREAWLMAENGLGVTFDLPTLKIQAYSTTPRVRDIAWWAGPNTGVPGIDPYIEISPRLSNYTNLDASGTILHEFGHHVMADAYGNQMPYTPNDRAHDGFLNPSSSDSWVEGFATFHALWTQRDQMKAPNPHLWPNGGDMVNLELNWKAWSTAEEFAVASLLWDLIDPVSMQDLTEMPVTNWADSPVVTTTGSSVAWYRDYIQMDVKELWRYISDATVASSNRHPAAPQGYNYVFDVKQFYHTLIDNEVGLKYEATDNGLDAVDELFIAHGFFADTNPQNLAWDLGEEIGATDHQAITVSGLTYAAHAPRRSPPPTANTFVTYRVQDASTGSALEVRDFLVTVRFDPPYEYYDYAYTMRALEPGRLQYAGPPRTYPATTTIVAAGWGVESSTELQFTNQQYWQLRDQSATGDLMDYVFEVDYSGVADPGGSEDGVWDGGSEDDIWDGGSEGDLWDGGIEPDPGVIVPGLTGGLLLPALCCGGGGLVLVLGVVVVVSRRSKKKQPGAHPQGAHPRGRAAPPRQAPPAASACPHCGSPAQPGTLFCGACGGSLAPAAAPQAAAGWQLRIVSGPNAGRSYKLGAKTTLGRSRENDIRLEESEASRQHAVLTLAGGGVTIQDLGSTNGTMVNGARISQRVALQPGDRVQIGGTVLEVSGSGAAIAAATLACPQCGHPAKPGTLFCGRCGAQL